MTESPIEDHLDELLRRTHADARTTRRALDEARDHLYAAASELEAGGRMRQDAEAEAVRRFGPVTPVARAATQRSLVALVGETLRAAVLLAGCGLVAIGLSGLVALLMTVWFGRSFVGGFALAQVRGASVAETAADAVTLRVIAGLVGLLALLGYVALRRRVRSSPLLPAGLVDALGAAAFAAGTAGLAIASVDQAVQHGTYGVGFPLSGAVIALPATVYFCVRAARSLLPSH
jgi:MYXO-CTERM domain-containing protein